MQTLNLHIYLGLEEKVDELYYILYLFDQDNWNTV